MTGKQKSVNISTSVMAEPSLQGGIIIPAMLPPPGVTSNFVNPYNLSKYVPVYLAVCLPITTAVVWIRIYAKIRLIKSHGWEDYTSLIAWLGLVVYTALYVKCVRSGVGVHQWNLPTQRATDAAFWANITELVYPPTFSITKLSILLMYVRLFMPNRRSKIYYLTQSIIWLNIFFYLSTFIAIAWQCIPRRKIWNPWVPGRCINANALLTVTAGINVLSDFSILLLPMRCIWQLHMPAKQKLAISAIFATGLLACAASIMRLIIAAKGYHTHDWTYMICSSAHWAYAEIAIGIICGCMPALPQFFRHLICKITTNLRYHRDQAKRILDKFRIKPKPFGCNVPASSLEASEHDGVERRRWNGFPRLVSFSGSSPGLLTVITGRLPKFSWAELFHKKERKGNGDLDLESGWWRME